MTERLVEPRVFFVMATLCGHSVWFSRRAAAGIEWCQNCGTYVGVMVTRKEGEVPSA